MSAEIHEQFCQTTHHPVLDPISSDSYEDTDGIDCPTVQSSRICIAVFN